MVLADLFMVSSQRSASAMSGHSCTYRAQVCACMMKWRRISKSTEQHTLFASSEVLLRQLRRNRGVFFLGGARAQLGGAESEEGFRVRPNRACAVRVEPYDA
jgi:hypothetical protein